MTYTQLCLDERNQIQQLLNQSFSHGYIAKTLSRSKSTIGREVRRGINLCQIKTYCSVQSDDAAKVHRHKGHSKLFLCHPH